MPKKILGRLVNISDFDPKTQERIRENLEDAKKTGRIMTTEEIQAMIADAETVK